MVLILGRNTQQSATLRLHLDMVPTSIRNPQMPAALRLHHLLMVPISIRNTQMPAALRLHFQMVPTLPPLWP